VQEVSALQALEGSVLSSSQVDALLLDLGLVLSHISSSNGSSSSSSSNGSSSSAAAAAGIGHAAIAEKARRLIAFACDQGWVAVASAVLPLASACGTCAHDIVAAIHNSTAQVGAGSCGLTWGVEQAVVLPWVPHTVLQQGIHWLAGFVTLLQLSCMSSFQGSLHPTTCMFNHHTQHNLG
jgi:hypothetical protein